MRGEPHGSHRPQAEVVAVACLVAQAGVGGEGSAHQRPQACTRRRRRPRVGSGSDAQLPGEGHGGGHSQDPRGRRRGPGQASVQPPDRLLLVVPGRLRGQHAGPVSLGSRQAPQHAEHAGFSHVRQHCSLPAKTLGGRFGSSTRSPAGPGGSRAGLSAVSRPRSSSEWFWP